ncbi:polyprenyl synthetase family protein [Kitasatospora purpeofusca]|uniref:polyprenyl synthetase family protein n=1 Tax=Kitasatospora purpeofusca TaxID=67352 RepID=UPI00368B1819
MDFPSDMPLTAPNSPEGVHVLRWAWARTRPALETAVSRLPGDLHTIARYHRGWCGPDGTATATYGPDAAGKAVRSALVLAACTGVGGQAEAAVPAAVAVELVHDFSLLHDDVMDGDRLRRGRPAAWTVFGIPLTVLAGDALLSLAIDHLAHGRGRDGPGGTGCVELFTGCLLELTEGQLKDLLFEARSEVSIDEYTAMAEGKTGALLGCACRLGALLGGAGPERSAALGVFGRRLGMVFQIADDLLGIWGDPGTTGKPAGSDLRSRKKSYPVIAALSADNAAARQLGKVYRSDRPLNTPEEVRTVAALVEAAGGRARAVADADRILAQALDDVRSSGPEMTALTALAHRLSRRVR